VDSHGFVLTGTAATATTATSATTAAASHAGHAPTMLETSVPGVFAVGDVRSGSVKRVGGAIGEGAAAVASIHQRLSGTQAVA